MVRYLTGVSNDDVRAVARDYDLGLLVTPDTAGRKSRARYQLHLSDYGVWAADNACFNHPDSFDVGTFLVWLSVAFSPAQRAACLWAVAPDVVGDAAKTVLRSLPVLPMIRSLGYRAAFVAQDGLQDLFVPWEEFDVLFIGGSTHWKLSRHARYLALEAKGRGKSVHMGRVNSYRRLKIANDFGCDTADGTFLAFGPDKNLPKLLGWLRRLRKECGEPDVVQREGSLLHVAG